MRGVDGEVASTSRPCFDPGEHRIEGVGQAVEFVVLAGAGNPLGQITGVNSFGARRQDLHGPHGPPHEPRPAEDQHDHGGHPVEYEYVGDLHRRRFRRPSPRIFADKFIVRILRFADRIARMEDGRIIRVESAAIPVSQSPN